MSTGITREGTFGSFGTCIGKKVSASFVDGTDLGTFVSSSIRKARDGASCLSSAFFCAGIGVFCSSSSSYSFCFRTSAFGSFANWVNEGAFYLSFMG